MKPLPIFAKAYWAVLVGGALCSHAFLLQAAPVAQLPGAQQQRAIDTEMRRQQKQQQLDALKDKKRRKKEADQDQLTPLVIVPEEMKALHHEGKKLNADEELPMPTEPDNLTQ